MYLQKFGGFVLLIKLWLYLLAANTHLVLWCEDLPSQAFSSASAVENLGDTFVQNLLQSLFYSVQDLRAIFQAVDIWDRETLHSF